MHTQCTGETQGSQNPAFPARWFDGLYAALSPEPSSCCLRRPGEIHATTPVGAGDAFAKA